MTSPHPFRAAAAGRRRPTGTAAPAVRVRRGRTARRRQPRAARSVSRPARAARWCRWPASTRTPADLTDFEALVAESRARQPALAGGLHRRAWRARRAGRPPPHWIDSALQAMVENVRRALRRLPRAGPGRRAADLFLTLNGRGRGLAARTGQARQHGQQRCRHQVVRQGQRPAASARRTSSTPSTTCDQQQQHQHGRRRDARGAMPRRPAAAARPATTRLPARCRKCTSAPAGLVGSAAIERRRMPGVQGLPGAGRQVAAHELGTAEAGMPGADQAAQARSAAPARRPPAPPRRLASGAARGPRRSRHAPGGSSARTSRSPPAGCRARPPARANRRSSVPGSPGTAPVPAARAPCGLRATARAPIDSVVITIAMITSSAATAATRCAMRAAATTGHRRRRRRRLRCSRRLCA